MSEFDVVIVGGGAAGLSSALVLSRARRTVAVVDAGNPRNAPAAHMQGYLSRDGMPPRELLAAGRAEVTSYGGTLLDDTVVGIDAGFHVHLTGGQNLHARRIVIATGLRDEVPDIPGVTERWGRDLLHCPYCHGYEVRDQPLGVLGGTPDAVQHALLLRQWSVDVLFFAHTSVVTAGEAEQLAARGIPVVAGGVARLVVRDDRLHGVELVDGTVVPRAAVFVRPRLVPNADLLNRLGCAVDERGWAFRDGVGRTSVPGVWVAGNAADPRAQVITAAGQGSAVAIDVNAGLVDEDVQHALANIRTH
ncbi:MAG: thioredoxin reductase [Frankiales bacterium]|nr:thioredoxin reductase [Frankiales bacterium]